MRSDRDDRPLGRAARPPHAEQKERQPLLASSYIPLTLITLRNRSCCASASRSSRARRRSARPARRAARRRARGGGRARGVAGAAARRDRRRGAGRAEPRAALTHMLGDDVTVRVFDCPTSCARRSWRRAAQPGAAVLARLGLAPEFAAGAKARRVLSRNARRVPCCSTSTSTPRSARTHARARAAVDAATGEVLALTLMRDALQKLLADAPPRARRREPGSARRRDRRLAAAARALRARRRRSAGSTCSSARTARARPCAPR